MKKPNKKTWLKMLLLVNKYLKVQLNYLNYLLIIFFHLKENKKKGSKWKKLGKSDLMLSRKISTNSTSLLSFH